MTTGTLLERTKVPLRTWLEVAWHLVDTKVGVSTTSVARLSGLDYRSAWGLFHKLRRAMTQSGRERLRGDVEFDETYVGGVEQGAPGDHEARSSPSPWPVNGSRTPRWAGSASPGFPMRLPWRSPTSSSTTWSRARVSSPTTGPPYGPALDELKKRGVTYKHRPTSLRASGERAHRVHPHVQRLAARFKRWMLGPRQGLITDDYLDAYLNEFVFQFNRRHSKDRGLVFWRLVCALVGADPFPRAELARRPLEQAKADRQHEEQVEAWRRAQRAALQRQRRHEAPEVEGRTVRPYQRQASDGAAGPH